MDRIRCQIARSAGKLAVPAIMIAAALALGGVALAGGGHQAVRAHAPVAIDGHMYPAGLLEFEKLASSSQLWAVSIDGRRVALVFRDRSTGAPGFALFRDDAGLLHIQGVHVAQVAGGASEFVYRRSGRAELDAVARLPARSID
jgi:hypothetical protein